MAFCQDWTLGLGVYLVMILLKDADFSNSLWTEKTIDIEVHMEQTADLPCNASGTVHDISWHKDTDILYSYSTSMNKSVTNYTSNRMKVDDVSPPKLKILNVQLSDKGNYTCTITTNHENLKIEWRLTVTENRMLHNRHQQPIHIFYSVGATGGIAFIVCCVVCLHRRWNDREHVGHVETRIEPQQGGRGSVNWSENHEYRGRLNSLYGHI